MSTQAPIIHRNALADHDDMCARGAHCPNRERHLHNGGYVRRATQRRANELQAQIDALQAQRDEVIRLGAC